MLQGATVGVLGGRGQAGRSIIPALVSAGARAVAFTRNLEAVGRHHHASAGSVAWVSYDGDQVRPLDSIVSTLPIGELPRYFAMIAASGARRVVVLSTTSLFTKASSPDPEERRMAEGIRLGEEGFKRWAVDSRIEWVILRPTMIYGYGRDHNVSSLLRFVQRFGFLPVLAGGDGLRQPVHVDDVAAAVMSALDVQGAAGREYNLSGGETLTYLELCRRLFLALGRRPRTLSIPRWLFRLCGPARRLLPARLRWLVAMLERMNQDLVFDHGPAARDLGFRPRRFQLTSADLAFDSSRIIP